MPGPSRILYVHNSADIYGASRSLLRLLGAMDRAKYEPLVMLPAEGPLATRVRETGVRVIVYPPLSVIDRANFRPARLPFFLLGIPRSVFGVWRILRRERVDLVHTNTGVILSPGLAARLAGVPHVWHIRDWFQEFRAVWKWHEHLMRSVSTKIIAVSEAIAGQFARREKVVVINNGFDLAEFPPVETAEREKARAQWQLGAVVTVGCVGRIKLVRKGQEVLLRAAGILKQRGISAKWLIVGAPFPGNESHLDELRRIAREGGIEADVIFTGELPDPRPAYAAMDVFVLPSAQPEPFGGVVMEAMGMGLPVVATAIGGSIDQVANDETGFLVNPGDPAALADKLELLIRDPALRARMGAAGRRRLEQKFSLKEMVAKIEAVYEECLK